jgi:hypothetical protein
LRAVCLARRILQLLHETSVQEQHQHQQHHGQQTAGDTDMEPRSPHIAAAPGLALLAQAAAVNGPPIPSATADGGEPPQADAEASSGSAVAAGVWNYSQIRRLQDVIGPAAAAESQRRTRGVTQILHNMRRRRRKLYYVSHALGRSAAAA